MMHHVPQAGLTALAVAGPVERVVRPHCAVEVRLGSLNLLTGAQTTGYFAFLSCMLSTKGRIRAEVRAKLKATEP
jgi:hypothetical protein